MKNNYILETAVEIPEVTLEDLNSLFVHDQFLKIHRLAFPCSLYYLRVPCLAEGYS